jgi:hypothetical protein
MFFWITYKKEKGINSFRKICFALQGLISMPTGQNPDMDRPDTSTLTTACHSHYSEKVIGIQTNRENTG